MFNPIKELITPRNPIIGLLFFVLFFIIMLSVPHVAFVYSGKIAALMFVGSFIFFTLGFRHLCLSIIDNNPYVQKYGYHPLGRVFRELDAAAEKEEEGKIEEKIS